MFLRAEGLDYILVTPHDYASLLTVAERRLVQAKIEADLSYETVYTNDGVVIKRRSM